MSQIITPNSSSNDSKDASAPLDLNQTHVDERTNVTFQEQRSTVVEDARVTGSFASNQVASALSMAETPWNISTILQRPVLIQTLSWDTTQIANAELAAFDFPNILASLTSQPVHQILSSFVYFRSNFCLRFQLNSTKFHIGRLVASVNPMRRLPDSSINLVSMTGLPNVKIDASESTLTELEVPFTHIQTYLTTNSESIYDVLARVSVRVFNQLQVSTGATSSLSLSVFAYMKQPSIEVPIYTHTPQLPSIQSHAPSIMEGVDDTISGVKGAVSNGLSGAWGKMVGSIGQAVGGVVTGLQSVFNFDMPTYPVPEHGRVTKFTSTLCHGTGRPAFDTRLSLHPVSLHVVDPSLSGTSGDEQFIPNIISTPMLIDQMVWETTISPGVLIKPNHVFRKIQGAFIVEPQMCWANVGVPNNNNIELFPTYLSFITSRFARWRGSLEFRLEVVCSQFHTGRLAISFIPNTPPLVARPLDAELMACPLQVLDLQESHEFSWTIQYVSSTVWKECRSFDAEMTDANTLGFMYISILNSLCAPNNVPNSVYLNLYVKAGDDFEVAVPRGIQYLRHPEDDIFTPAPPPSSSVVENHAPELNAPRSSAAVESSAPGIMKGELRSKSADSFYGENFHSLVDICRRFCLLAHYDRTIPDTSDTLSLRVPVTPYQTDHSFSLGDESSYVICQNFLHFFSHIYVFWSGSIRYRFIFPNASGLHAVATHDPTRHYRIFYEQSYKGFSPDMYDNIEQGQASSFNVTSLDPSVEVECPFYSIFPMCVVDSKEISYDNLSFVNGGLELSVKTYGANRNISGQIWLAGGDDFRFHFLIPPPPIYVGRTAQ